MWFFIVGLISFTSWYYIERVPEKTCEVYWEMLEEKWIGRRQERINGVPFFENLKSIDRMAYDVFEPEWTCEMELRVGRPFGDGAKWACDPAMLKERKDCLIYSIGSNYDDAFEMHSHSFAPKCEIHVFQLSLQRKLPICTNIAILLRLIHFMDLD